MIDNSQLHAELNSTNVKSHLNDNNRIAEILNNQLGLNVNFPLMLAPMVGLSHVVLRQLIRSYLPLNVQTIWPTEMLNSKRIPLENLQSKAEGMKDSNEKDIIPQILGNEENSIAVSVKKLKEWGAVGIDINMGCPVQKALRHNYGVALMGDPNYAAEVVRMTVRNTDLPVSVKLRVGLQSDPEYLIRFVEGLQKAGASWICLHPRTAAQKRRGFADWSQIHWLRQRINIPIIGNGDIQTSQDVLQMIQQTNCDMVMSGRALAARPWMVWQLAEDLGMKTINTQEKNGVPVKAPRGAIQEAIEYGNSLLKYMDLLQIYYGAFSEDLQMRKLRFHIKTTSVWLNFGHALYALTTQVQTVNEAKMVIQEFFNKHQLEMYARTDLRE